MRRKYDLRNKRNFIIILVISIAVICVFSLFILRYRNADKVEYQVLASSVIQDIDRNYVSVDKDATLKIRWNDRYYLIYDDKNINLSKKIIVYNTLKEKISLYGDFYEIQSDGKIIDLHDETVLNNTTDTKFYKLDDREYLLVSRSIVSDDRSIEASNYLLVELDNQGNAKLSNNKLNLKTINSTVLVTSEYKFDINNEILTYKGIVIDLKKIIGSTNKFNSESSSPSGSGGTGSGTGDGTGDGTGTGTGTGSGAGGAGGNGTIINNNDIGDVSDIGELKSKTKMTSVIRTTEGLNQIDIDYVIYDPYNEYKSIYMEVTKTDGIETIYLSKNDTHVIVDNLNVNTEYNIKFNYTIEDSETKNLKTITFDELNLKTKMPEFSISVFKISSVYNTLSYKVYLDPGFSTDEVNVSLSFEHRETDPETGIEVLSNKILYSTVNPKSGSNYVIGSFNLSDYDIQTNSILRLSIDNVEGSGTELSIDSSSSFRFGR